MGNHTLESMSRGAIEEYLAVSHHCITTRKPRGGAYGYPAVLLLFSVVDALSSYAGHAEHSFGVLKDIFPGLSDTQITHLKNWYRHLPAHQAIIMPGTAISVELPGDPIELNAAGEPTHIRLLPFWESVAMYWRTTGVANVAPSFRQERAPKAATAIIAEYSNANSTQAPAPSSVYVSAKSSTHKPKNT
jgi:hypothetical protein